MTTQALGRTIDGFTSLERGVDSGFLPSAIQQNQVSWAINKRFRKGYANSRPGLSKIKLDFGGDTDLETAWKKGNFQGATYYDPPNDTEVMVCSIKGKIYRLKISNNKVSVIDISIPGDANFPNATQAYFQQVNQYLVMQNGINKAQIWDGAFVRRALSDEVPVGTSMAWGMGRLWVANQKEFVAGDIDGGPTGPLKFTEATYLAGGGAFSLPIDSGNITSMDFVAQMNTTAGQGELLVFTRTGVTSVLATYDRSQWTTTQIQRIALVKNGSTSSRSNVVINGDIYFRAVDGLRSYIMAQRDFASPGQSPISGEMERVIEKDTDFLLQYTSSVLFDNRLLMTVSPKKLHYGCYSRGFMALDFNPLSKLGAKGTPAYDGLWTGVNPMQFVTGSFDGHERCFIFSYNPDTQENELWELSKDNDSDYSQENGQKRIISVLETQSFGFYNRFELKKLQTADLWVDEIRGNVNFKIQFRPDQYPCWYDYHEWNECNPLCKPLAEGECLPVRIPQPGYRPRMRLPIAPSDDDIVSNTKINFGYEFQFRIITEGKVRIKGFRCHADKWPEAPYGNCIANNPACDEAPTYDCCNEDIFGYKAY